MTISLYDLSTNYAQALDFLTDPENDIDFETTLDTIAALNGELSDKMLNVARFIVSIEHQALGIAEMEKRQKSRRQALENKASWLRDYLQAAMSNTGITKLSDKYLALSLVKLPASVIIDDETLIPDIFWKEKLKRSISKTAIKEAGGCSGARFGSTGFRLSIK